MKRLVMAGLMTVMLAAGTARAEEAPAMPEMPKPVKEHAWLRQIEGEWTTEAKLYMQPDAAPMVTTGTEKVRSLGGFWIVAEGESTVMGTSMTSVLTLGYDPERKSYTGTWIGSCASTLWQYEGSVDETGKILTLNTEGPCPTEPGKISKFREVMEIKSAEHRVFTSSIQGDDGKWTKMVEIDYRRKKQG